MIQGTPPLGRLSGGDIHGHHVRAVLRARVHKQTVVACVLLPGAGRQPAKEIRTFGTMTADLLDASSPILNQPEPLSPLSARGAGKRTCTPGLIQFRGDHLVEHRKKGTSVARKGDFEHSACVEAANIGLPPAVNDRPTRWAPRHRGADATQ